MTELSSYMSLIQYEGPLQPTYKVLHDLHTRHTRSIPFENLSPFTGMPVNLDVPSILNKFARQHRGGYCYEHNLLFRHVLEDIGFTVQGLAARVRMNTPDDVMTPRSHMLLLVEAEGETFVADTGFGSLTLTAPIRFETGSPQETPHGPYRMLREANTFMLQAYANLAWQNLYLFDVVPHYQEDYEVFNWHVSTHPASLFVNNLVAARPAPEGRHVLNNTRYSFYRLDGTTEQKQLGSVAEIRAVLENAFLITTSEVPELDKRISALLHA